MVYIGALSGQYRREREAREGGRGGRKRREREVNKCQQAALITLCHLYSLKYSENKSAFIVALIRISFRSGLPAVIIYFVEVT